LAVVLNNKNGGADYARFEIKENTPYPDWECKFKVDSREGAERATSQARVKIDSSYRQTLQNHIGTAKQLRLNVHRLAAPSRLQVGERTTTLAYDGRGLAGVLSIWRLFNEPLFDEIQRELQNIVPSVERIRIAMVPFKEKRYEYDDANAVWIDREVTGDRAALRFDFTGAPDIPASETSQGTMLSLGLLTAARAASGPRIVLLDDIEQALHPRAQRKLVEVLRSLVERTPGLQIIATSHSPYLVDAFRPEEVVVLGLRKDGTAAARRLSDHPDAKRAMEVLSTGEFLAAEQEDWVVEGAP
jgi:hypothetical protein